MSALFPIQMQPSWGSSLRPPVSHPPWEISASTQRGPVQTASAGSCGRHPDPHHPWLSCRGQAGRANPSQSCHTGQFSRASLAANPPGSCPPLPWGAGSTPQQCEPGAGMQVLVSGNFGAVGWRVQPHRLTIASQGEDGLGADGTCSARERAFLLLMLSGGNASQAFWMAL